MRKIPFGWVFAGAALLSFYLSALLEIGWIYLLGCMACLYLFGLMLIGVFTPSPKPYSGDESIPKSDIAGGQPPGATAAAEHPASHQTPRPPQ